MKAVSSSSSFRQEEEEEEDDDLEDEDEEDDNYYSFDDSEDFERAQQRERVLIVLAHADLHLRRHTASEALGAMRRGVPWRSPPG